MYVNSEVKKIVVYLGYQTDLGETRFAGTAFFIIHPFDEPFHTKGRQTHGHVYLVTAKHVIDGIRSQTQNPIRMRVNLKTGGFMWVDCNDSNWSFHPSEPEKTDVAVMSCMIPEEFDCIPIRTTAFATPRIQRILDVSVGDEVFIAGMFSSHRGRHRNIPIIRVGNIAAMPEEPIDVDHFGEMEAFIIEARSFGGISGSPVFLNVPAERAASLLTPEDQRTSLTQFYSLIGIMHGHWDQIQNIGDSGDPSADALVRESVNMGLAIVVPCTKILEVIAAIDRPRTLA